MTLPLLQERGGALNNLIQGASQGLQQAMPSIQDMIMSRMQQKQKQQQIQSILGNAPQAAQGKPDLGMESSAMQGLEITPEKIVAMSQVDPQVASNMARIFQGQEKERMQKQKLSEESKVGQDSFNRMAQLLKRGNIGLGSGVKGSVLGGKTAEEVGEFNSLTGALEAMLVDRVSRGTLSNARFKYITESLLPKATDRQSTIKGKLKALAKTLGLDPGALTGKEGASA